MNKHVIVTASIVALVLGLLGPGAVHAAGPLPVDLLSAGNFVILSKTGITNTGSHASFITGNIGSSPITAAAMDNVFCSEITGTIYGVDAAYTGSGSQACFAGNPPLSNKTLVDNAVLDMETAYTDAAGRTIPDGTELYAGNLGGQTFAPGLYKWSTDVTIPTNVTLAGGANDVWIFQIAGNLDIASGGSIPAGIKVVLTGGAKASNVFWQVGGLTGATLGTYSTFNGNILSAKQVIIQTGAVLNGRALAQTQVTLDANTVSIPTLLHIIKLVVNGSGGAAVPGDFTVSVKNLGVDVSGSPAAGTSAPGTSYALSAGTYVVSETPNASYVQTFTGDCDAGGTVVLASGDNKTCTVVNTDIPLPPAVPPPSSGGGGGGSLTFGVPLIGLLKVPSPLAISSPSGGLVTYHYTAWNVASVGPLTGVTVVDDKCSPVTLLSGDTNGNARLDPGEQWKYSCATTLSQTTTNTAIATGYGDDAYHQTAIATAITTVVVGTPVAPPLINLLKIPSRLTPFPFGGGDVTYSYVVTNPGVVPIRDVTLIDDKCSPVFGRSGDANGDNRLDPNETWTYTCRTNISASTRNTATVEGTANGITALGYAFATVLVSAPGLPNTGFAPRVMVSWDILLLAGVLMTLAVTLSVKLRSTDAR